MEVYFFHELQEISLIHTQGEVINFEELPSVLNKPLVIKPEGNIQGFESGGRGALIPNETYERFFKIKGCDPSINPFEDREDPIGGQRFSSTQAELDNAAKLGSLFEKEGLTPAYRPVGYFLYNMEFTHPKGRETERLAASLFEINGETRLGDFIGKLVPPRFWIRRNPYAGGKVWLHAGESSYYLPIDVYETIPPEVKSVLEKFGIWAGLIKGFMDRYNYTWTSRELPTNAHLKNFVLLGDGNDERAEYISLGAVDFDRSKRWKEEDKSEMKHLQEFEYRYLITGPSYWQRGFEKGYQGIQPEKIQLKELLNARASMERVL